MSIGKQSSENDTEGYGRKSTNYHSSHCDRDGQRQPRKNDCAAVPLCPYKPGLMTCRCVDIDKRVLLRDLWTRDAETRHYARKIHGWDLQKPCFRYTMDERKLPDVHAARARTTAWEATPVPKLKKRETIRIDAILIPCEKYPNLPHLTALLFRHLDGTTKRILLPRSELVNATALKKKLLDAGMDPNVEITSETIDTLQKQLSKQIVYSTTPGWEDGEFFIPGDHRPPESTAEHIVLPNETTHSFLHYGSADLAIWQRQFEPLCRVSPLLTFLLSAAFAGPLLTLIGVTELPFIYLSGPSRSGKSTAMKAALSVYGGPIDRAPNFSTTMRRLEETLPSTNGHLAFLDDINIAEADKQFVEFIMSLAYNFASAGGKVRSQAVQLTVPDTVYGGQVLMANGESTLDEFAKTRKKSRRQGAKERTIELEVLGAEQGGLLHSPFYSGTHLFEMLEKTSKLHGGAAGRSWVSYIIRNTDRTRERAIELRTEWARRLRERDPSPIAEKVALFAAAGELAYEAGVAPFTPQTLKDAIHWAHDQAVLHCSGSDHDEEEVIIDAAKVLLSHVTQHTPSIPANYSGASHDLNGARIVIAYEGDQPCRLLAANELLSSIPGSDLLKAAAKSAGALFHRNAGDTVQIRDRSESGTNRRRYTDFDHGWLAGIATQ